MSLLTFTKRFVGLLVVLLLCVIVRAQTPVPFAGLERQVKSQGGWGGPKEPLAREFNAARKRLGDRFENELLKYVGTDVERHYWTSLFLDDAGYRQGNKPLPHLSLLLKQQGLALLEGKRDEDSLLNVVMLSVTAAVLAERMHLHALAVSYKGAAESLMDRDPALKGAFPAMYPDERKVYDRIVASKTKTF